MFSASTKWFSFHVSCSSSFRFFPLLFAKQTTEKFDLRGSLQRIKFPCTDSLIYAESKISIPKSKKGFILKRNSLIIQRLEKAALSYFRIAGSLDESRLELLSVLLCALLFLMFCKLQIFDFSS